MMNTKITVLQDKTIVFALTFLLLSFCYIAFLVMDPRCGWVLPESLIYKSYIVHNVPLKDVLKGTFNNQVFENSDRITRPLSSLFEIIDTHFRAWLWQFIRPVASLSLTFIFSLLIGPILYYKFLKNMAIRPAIAVFATAIMLLNPGSLSLIVMMFRPAKAMMNFWLIFSLYFSSLIYLKDKEVKPSLQLSSLMLIVGAGILLGFLFDETAVVIVTAIALLCPSVFMGSTQRVLGFALVPVILLLLYLIVFPAMAVHYGYSKPDLLAYQAISAPNLPSLSDFISNYFANFKDISIESLGMFNPYKVTLLTQKILYAALMITAVIFIGRYVISGKTIKSVSFPVRNLVIRSFLLLLVLCLFHTFILDTVSIRTDGRVWGPYYYGAYFGIFWGILIAAVGEASAQIKNRVSRDYMLLMSLMCLGLMTAFPYTNFFYHRFHYDPYYPPLIEFYYRGDFNRFEAKDFKMFGDKRLLTDAWHASQKGEAPVYKREFAWIPVEMGIPTAWH
jgi:hypothetical protein